MRQGFNRRWYAANLQAVYAPTTTSDVAELVETALTTYGRNVKVTSGRHCYENFVFNDDTLAIIDTSGLSGAGYDRDRNAYFIEAGCSTWAAYLTLLNGHGKTIPAGTCSSVGAGGHISGGGYGLLSRLHGLTVDHLSAVDIVTWDSSTGRAHLRRVSPTSTDHDERDLFWALCGAGGGNFGVIVRYWFDELPDAPARATHWSLGWNWADLTPRTFAALVEEYTDLAASLPLEQHSSLRLTHASAGHVGMFLQVASDTGRAAHAGWVEKYIATLGRRFAAVARARPALRALPGGPEFLHVPPATRRARTFTYLDALSAVNDSGPSRFSKHKSAYMRRGFPPDQIDAMYEWLNRSPAGLDDRALAHSLLAVGSYGGAVNTRPRDATPVHQRSSILKLQYQTYWTNGTLSGAGDAGAARAQEEAHLAWIRGFYQDMYAAYGGVPDPALDASGTVDGCYYNYPDADLGTVTDGRLEQALRLYFGDNLRSNPRNLVAVKQRWDPHDYFNSAQSIPVR